MGLVEGREQGIAEGKEAGEAKFSSLISRLSASGRTEEITRAANDAQFRQRLYEEFGIDS